MSSADPCVAALQAILDICEDAVDSRAALELIQQRAQDAIAAAKTEMEEDETDGTR